jgi:hypothetical protein
MSSPQALHTLASWSSWLPRLGVAAGLLGGCGHGRFGADVAFLEKHTDVVVLSDAEGQAKVAVCPKLQGRVMTSTAGGDSGAGHGFINYELIESGKPTPHMNAYGGEDRLWLGPEGGQFGLFFPKGAAFELDNWQVPAPLDTEAFDVVARSTDRVRFAKIMRLSNRAGTSFDLEVQREVRLVAPGDAWSSLGVDPPPSDARVVAFESDNRVTNAGREAWRKDAGLVSIWILGMFRPSAGTRIILPLRPGQSGGVNDDYFGKIPAERLRVDSDVVIFRGDGQQRGKIGVAPRRARPVAGSYDDRSRVLTLVQFTLPEGVSDYVDSTWKEQMAPFAGDAVNSYNDGPPAEGQAPLGPFYEIESSSPAAALEPGASISHVHRTIHVQGSYETLDALARTVLGVSLERVTSAFSP